MEMSSEKILSLLQLCRLLWTGGRPVRSSLQLFGRRGDEDNRSDEMDLFRNVLPPRGLYHCALIRFVQQGRDLFADLQELDFLAARHETVLSVRLDSGSIRPFLPMLVLCPLSVVCWRDLDPGAGFCGIVEEGPYDTQY